MATIDISPAAGTPASTGYLIYTDATTGTFKKAPLSALPLSDAVVSALAAKQATLVSGTNIKTINGTSVLGSGDITVSGSGTGLGTPVSFSETIPLNIGNSYMVGNASAGPHTFVPGTSEQTGACTLYYKADGSGAPDTSAWIDRNGGITNYDDTVDMINELLFYRARSINMVAVTPIGVESVLTLDTPSFSADAVSDDEIDLTSITYDSDSEAMTIERATNAGFTTGLTSLYSGVPKSSHNDTGLTASTHYYYRIQTTASGFTDSDYGYDDDTTDASGLTQLSTPGSFSLVADSATSVTCTWADIANETNFSVQIATNAGFSAGVQAATKSANVLTHQFTGLTPGTTYYGHVKGIGDGVTFSDSAYSTADNDTTPAVTLNAPTSFAAGTPTADGAPFTWNDTNTSPAESSYLIQITTAADTGYAAVVTTRTPAANATSAAAGTGLTDSTNYRARIKAVGNGTTTLDSAYSSEVTFTTAAAGGLVPLDFTGSTGMQSAGGLDWESNAANAGYGNKGKTGTKIAAGTSGRIMTDWDGTANGVNFGLNAANAEVGYAGMEVALAFQSATTTVLYIENGGSTVGNATTSASNGTFCINKVAGVGVAAYTIEKSTDGGLTWGSPLYTYAYTADVDLWVVADCYGTGNGPQDGLLVNPQGENLV